VGIKTIILPARNRVDLEDIPEEIRKELCFVFAERVDDVFHAALDSGADTGEGRQTPATE
jgi:ATP-dependent Lon protease